ncbi:MAG: D-alanyl-D-alanine carboxypeptidase/D-alanyl-D-alanine-endopeptidase [Aquabacterium sp.]|nr:D-alanyl-D-alanine carboxypeptidase/D-alanyl-D-alanine-endopeptidase [Aquabacterium sp.]
MPCVFAPLLVALAEPAAAREPARQALPAAVHEALAQAGLPATAMAVHVQALDAERPHLSWRADEPMNPASLFKLVTTLAALELLGPTHTWQTPVWVTGPLRDGVLSGDVVIQGRGDPTLVPERQWLLLQRLRQWGVREIHGDIVLDRSAFSPQAQLADEFDGEPLRPYNTAADALLLSYRSIVYTFTPDPAAGVARVSAVPRLHGHSVQPTVALSDGACDDWRAALKATAADVRQMRFDGRYPSRCGERIWPLAWSDPPSYDSRTLQAAWTDLGGRLAGSVRDGAAPTVAPSFVVRSRPLGEVVRDINKYSNNVMAQQLFLTLGLQLRGQGTPEAAREVLREWLQATLGNHAATAVIDNGSGLSRRARLCVSHLTSLVQAGWRSGAMPQWLASLPRAGEDGTASRMNAGGARSYLKTGSLRDVTGVAGVVVTQDGRSYAVAAIVNHPQAHRGRGAIEALLRWLNQKRVDQNR